MLLAFLSINLVSAIILLVFTRINYLLKGVLVSLIGSSWIFWSINFLAIHSPIFLDDPHGVIFLISTICGIGVSILAGIYILAFFIEKEEALR